jgi:hypothetical protein
MLGGRLRLSRSPVAVLGTGMLVLVALALVWYGTMTAALALKASPDQVASLSGYRAAYDALAGLEPADITPHTRAIAGPAGLAALLVFGFLAFKELPRAHYVRQDLRVSEQQLGRLDVAPRVVERIGEVAAGGEPAVSASHARLAERELEVELALADPGEVAEALRGARRRALDAMAYHGLPVTTVNVTLTAYRRSPRKELQ